MKITKSQLKQIIKEELLKEDGGAIGNFGGVVASPGPPDRSESPPLKDEPDSVVQQKAAQFFMKLEITDKVVGILVNNIAIPDLIVIMEKVPKIHTAEEELHEEEKNNPWAICTASVGREDKEKYEKCVKSIKKEKGIE